jgi:hypothetical protein
MAKQKTTSNVPLATVERFITAIRAVDWIIELPSHPAAIPRGTWR